MRFTILPLLALLSLSAWAIDDSEHATNDHATLVPDPSLTLRGVVELTAARYPHAVELPAREKEAKAWQDKGGSWLSGQPLLTGRYQTDKLQDDEGLKELEAGVRFPLWNWGQRSATRNLGEALDFESDAAAAAMLLEVAAIVRQLLWDFQLAETGLYLAERSLETARKRSAALQRRYELGDISLADTVLAKTAVLDRETQVVEAEAAYVDASRMYFSVTGTEYYPPDFSEEQSNILDVEATHPLMVLAQSSVERADAGRNYQASSRKNNPTLQVGPRSEQPLASIDAQSSIGIQVEFPFGGGSHVRAATAQSERDYAAVQADRLQLERDLDIAVHEAEHELFVVRKKAELADQRLELLTQHLSMGESAFQKGELDLLALLLLQGNADIAAREAAGLSIGVQHAIATYNQAVGELP